ncbi:hypothetical protein PG996_014937 [Apiospora saccharicola]|uniref:Uncharacterized protein n=1 Tax=Apiospora saccharicola TaxID=335842 RepID=A0ABR1TJQ8_9PEZI
MTYVLQISVIAGKFEAEGPSTSQGIDAKIAASLVAENDATGVENVCKICIGVEDVCGRQCLLRDKILRAIENGVRLVDKLDTIQFGTSLASVVFWTWILYRFHVFLGSFNNSIAKSRGERMNGLGFIELILGSLGL